MKIFILALYLIFTNVYSQKITDYEIYIVGESSDESLIVESQNDTTQIKYYRKSWPKRCDHTKIALRISDKGELVHKISIGAVGSHIISFRYENRKNENPGLRISPEILEQKIKLDLDEFPNYIFEDLVNVLSKAKAIYLVFENEKSTNEYFARMVSFELVPQL